MKRVILLAIVMLAGCGSEEDQCRREIVSGLCLYKGGFDISSEAISETVMIVQKNVNAEYPGLDLPYLLEAYSVFAKYVPRYRLSGNVRGLYRYDDHRIFVNGIDAIEAAGESANMVCREHYYVLGHEMLHFIIMEYLGDPQETSNSHSHPLFMASVSGDRYTAIVETVEGQIYLDVMRMCNDLVGPVHEE